MVDGGRATEDEKMRYLLNALPPPAAGSTVWAFVVLPGMYTVGVALFIPLVLIGGILGAFGAVVQACVFLWERAFDAIERQLKHAEWRASWSPTPPTFGTGESDITAYPRSPQP